MDYKEKYEAALAVAQETYNTQPMYREWLESMFPELRGSEDERIRKALMQNLKERFGTKGNMGEGLDMPDVLTWLEKQKPDDKVEPKFHEGEWVVYDHRPYQVVELPKEGYINLGLRGNGKIEFAPSTYCRHWTIQDAKDGDVLANSNISVFIYAEVLYNKPYAYCGVDKFGVFKDNCRKNDWSNSVDDIHPATKEQRDLLFQKMKEAGYEWDAEKKELKKIEQKPAIKLELDDNGEPVLTPFEAELFSMMSEAWQGYSFGEEVNIAKIVKEHSIELLERANEENLTWSEEEIEKAAQEWDSKASFRPFYMSPTGVKQDVTTHTESIQGRNKLDSQIH